MVYFHESRPSLTVETEIEEEIEEEDSLMKDVSAGLKEIGDWTIELNEDCFDNAVQIFIQLILDKIR